jgi:isopentenyl phosphate kinase
MTERSEVVFIKLGGSLITDKRRHRTARVEVIKRLARELRTCVDRGSLLPVIGHGSGSFGHVAAERWQIHRGISSRDQLAGVVETQSHAAELHAIVLQALLDNGLRAYSLAPSSFVLAAGGKPGEAWSGPFLAALKLGLMPVVYGDVVMDTELGASICSTESLFRQLVPAVLAEDLSLRRVIWLGETEGIYDESRRTLDSLSVTQAEELLGRVEGAAGTDVTGGVRHRLQAAIDLARLGVTSWIANGLAPDELERVLQGEARGTQVLAALP